MLRTFVHSIEVYDDTCLLDWLFWLCSRNWILGKSVNRCWETWLQISMNKLIQRFRSVLFISRNRFSWVNFWQLLIWYFSDFGNFLLLKYGQTIVILASVLFVGVFFVLFSVLSRQNSLDQIGHLFARNHARMHIVRVLLENVADYLVNRKLFAQQIG